MIDDQTYQSDDPVLTGRQLLQFAGRTPVEEHVVLYFGERRQLEDIDLEETVNLQEPGREKFVTFRSDRLFNFELDGERQPWGADLISESVLRHIAGLGEHGRVWLERRDQEDRLLQPGEEVSLNPQGLERFYTERAVTIIVNGRRKSVDQTTLTFDELLALAFDPVPDGPNWCFTATYRNGPTSNPEGTLVEGKSVRIKDGMVFNVTATDKS
ncbi:MAG: multiubiquitin domain-containing protein [Planctomycetales bacterium]|nr:multiubiquitin domain-containing protein [Planctomycetales bacterium]